jgi:hypothetical protein
MVESARRAGAGVGVQDEGLGGAGRWKLNMKRSLANLKTRVNLMQLVYGSGLQGGMASGGAGNMEDDAGDDSDGDARSDDSDDEELFQVRCLVRGSGAREKSWNSTCFMQGGPLGPLHSGL